MHHLDLGQLSVNTETLIAAGKTPLLIDKYHFRFQSWGKPHVLDTYGGKQILQLNNEPLFAELLLLRLLEQQGYKGVWVDTYSNKFWQRLPHFGFPVIPDSELMDLYHKIYACKGGRRSGCFDIMAHKKEHFVFAELKKQKEDRIRPTQVEWLHAAKAVAPQSANFFIAEWEVCAI